MICVIFVLLTRSCFSQGLIGEWVDCKYFEAYNFSTDTVVWSYGNSTRSFEYQRLQSDSMIKITTYRAWQKGGEWIVQHPVNLISVTFPEKEKVLLKPANANAKNEFFFSQDSITLIRRSSLIPQKVRLKEIYFESSGCLGNCKAETFYMDSLFNFYFIGNYNLGDREGYFKGKLTKEDKLYLEEILSEGFIQKIPSGLGLSIDAQYFNIIVKRDGITQHIRGTGIPDIAWKMIGKLIDFHKRLNLVREKEFKLDESIIK